MKVAIQNPVLEYFAGDHLQNSSLSTTRTRMQEITWNLHQNIQDHVYIRVCLVENEAQTVSCFNT